MTNTPMLDKMSQVRDSSQTIGEFVEWLGSQGIQLGNYGEHTYPDEPCDGEIMAGQCEDGRVRRGTHGERDCNVCNGQGRRDIVRTDFQSDGRSIEKLLADYFEIDLDAVEQERRAILSTLGA